MRFVAFTLPATAVPILRLSDPERMASCSLRRSPAWDSNRGQIGFEGPLWALLLVLDELDDRGRVGGGFEHTKQERGLARYAARAVRKQMAQNGWPCPEPGRVVEADDAAGCR